MSGVPRCCARCGRWGNRAFREDRAEVWVCTNDRACNRRTTTTERPERADEERASE